MMFVVTFAALLCTGVSLRPESPDKDRGVDDQAVAAALADLSALSDSSRSTPADSLATLGEVNQIVSSLTSPGPPPSLSEETKEALRKVLTLIQETVYSEMDGGHQTDVADLASANDAVASCNAAVVNGMSETGTIGISKGSAQGKQMEYQDAVAQKAWNETNEATHRNLFDAHMASIMPLATCNSFPADHSKSEEKWIQYFNVPPDVEFFKQEKQSFEEKQTAFHDAKTDLENAITHLASTRGALKDAFCNMMSLMQAACNELQSCYPTKLEAFNVIRDRAATNMQLRKDAHAAGESAVEQLRLLLGLEASEGVEKDYGLDIPTPEAEMACSTDMIRGDEAWEDFLDESICN